MRSVQHQSDPALSALIRGSPLLDPAMKRHWLRILPLLSPRDVERLRETLQAAGHDSTTPLVRDGAHP